MCAHVRYLLTETDRLPKHLLRFASGTVYHTWSSQNIVLEGFCLALSCTHRPPHSVVMSGSKVEFREDIAHRKIRNTLSAYLPPNITRKALHQGYL